MTRWSVIVIVISFVLAGCSRGSTPEGVAEQFVEAYYVRIDQIQALEFAAALAREKLQQELQLVAQARRGGSVEQARPKIKYTRSDTRSEGRQVFFIYELTIQPAQFSPILKQVLITTEQLDEQWKVINFTEMDRPR